MNANTLAALAANLLNAPNNEDARRLAQGLAALELNEVLEEFECEHDGDYYSDEEGTVILSHDGDPHVELWIHEKGGQVQVLVLDSDNFVLARSSASREEV